MFSCRTTVERWSGALQKAARLSDRQNVAWYDLQALVLAMLLRFAR
jgi:hypothetical protein